MRSAVTALLLLATLCLHAGCGDEGKGIVDDPVSVPDSEGAGRHADNKKSTD